jgi:plastocyanin
MGFYHQYPTLKKSKIQIIWMISTIIISSFFIIGSLYGGDVHKAQMASAIGEEKNSNATITNNISKTTNASSSILNQLSVKEEETSGVYKWINASNTALENPMINVFTNTSSTIKIQNPTDTKHKLIIDTGKDVLPSSDDISPGSSGQISINLNTTGTFTYHCAYHPYTMKGTVEVISK